jgi:hypothetical protein
MEYFTIEIPCKPWIKKYLAANFGAKPNLKEDPCLYHFFIRLLKRSLTMQDHRIDLSKYRSNVTVLFSEDVFRRVGFRLSKTDIEAFNVFCEGYIKKQLIIHIDSHLRYNDNLANAIRTAQEEFDFSDDDFQFDSIKKYYVRNSIFYKKFIASPLLENASAVEAKKSA